MFLPSTINRIRFMRRDSVAAYMRRPVCASARRSLVKKEGAVVEKTLQEVFAE